jgi:hypothetical protein
VSDVATNQSKWLVSPIQAKQCFEAMATHHGQLKAMYGILHLAAKIIDLVDVKETLFVDVVGHTPRPELEPRRWRSAVQTDSFFDARHFGFHYKVRFSSFCIATGRAASACYRRYPIESRRILDSQGPYLTCQLVSLFPV